MFKIDETLNGWLSPSGDVFFISDISHQRYICDMYLDGTYVPSEAAMANCLRDQKDCLDEDGRLKSEHVIDMALYDGWIRFLGGDNYDWSAETGACVSFHCGNFEALKVLHGYMGGNLLPERIQTVQVEVPVLGYWFEGAPAEFRRDGLRRRWAL
jgi:hypothetical protein